jgi:hypothetical protein
VKKPVEKPPPPTTTDGLLRKLSELAQKMVGGDIPNKNVSKKPPLGLLKTVPRRSGPA